MPALSTRLLCTAALGSALLALAACSETYNTRWTSAGYHAFAGGDAAATAQYYEGELDYRLKKLTAMFEPMVIVVMGLVVGFVALALIQAMYGIFGQVHP